MAGCLNEWQTEDGEAVIEVALKDPHKFVVKPQREGGGYHRCCY